MESRLAAIFAFAALLAAGCAAPVDSGSRGLRPPRASIPAGMQRVNAMIYGGAGSWEPEVSSLERILYEHGASYQEVDSSELEKMSLDDLTRFDLLVFPGGDAKTVSDSLSKQAHSRLRKVVQERGVSYLGYCAGAWLAIAPAPTSPDSDVSYGFGIADGPVQEPHPLAHEGKEFALQLAKFPNGSQRNLLWYGGPVTPEHPGGVVARYPDGKPAITELWSGNGLVLVSGLHPAATQAVFRSLGLFSSYAPAFDLAWDMLDAGIQRRLLPAFQ